ncbi:prominin-1-A-like isoform X1 [Acropora muricata]|uniref:prominin-1-A-like isoform X1 n=1 Tax=Acropora muricata TaxID=159855 RepID=UPI0034E3CCD0
MASIMVLTQSLLVVFICVASYGSCEEPTLNGSEILWNDKFDKKGEEGTGLKTEYDAKGLQPWYNFANFFISIVLNKEPYDLVKKVKNGVGDTTEFVKNDVALGYALGMIICVGLGFLFIIIMPIVGLCFCCCRCCGNCGGDMSQADKPNNNCKRAVFGAILTVITLVMLSCVLMTFVCNDRMSDTVDQMVDTSKGILNEAIFFINRTVGEVDKVLVVDFPFVTEQISNEISDENLIISVGAPILNELDAVSVKPIEAVQRLSETTKRMRDQLEVITNNSQRLSNLTEELSSGLNKSRTNLDEIKTECTNNSALSNNTSCGNIDTSSLAAEANFTNLPDVSEQLSNVKEVVDQDFEKSAQEGLNEARNIPGKVINDTRGIRAEIRTQISDASKTVSNLSSDLSNIANDNVISRLKTWRDVEIPKVKDYAKQYDHYRWIAGVGLTCMLLLIVVLMALGLMCGICGHDKESVPTTRGSVSNMGGLSLMAATGFCFIFASLLMLLTTICFILGAPAQIVCKSIETGDLYSKVLDDPSFWGSDGYILSRSILGEKNKDVPFTIAGFLQNCRENKPLYVAGPFAKAFNISDRLNIEKLLGNDSKQNFEDLKVNLSDVEVLSSETQRSLSNLSDSGVDDIDFDAFLNETRKGITAGNLTELAENVTKVAIEFRLLNTPKANELADKANATAQGLRDLDTNVVQVMAKLADDLGRNVEDLKGIGSNIKAEATVALKRAQEAQDNIQINSSKTVDETVSKFINRVLGFGYQFTDHVLSLLNNDLARCKPVANIYDASITFPCKQVLYPFNGFWFSIGFCLLFFIPAIIFNVKLAKHYRRMTYERDMEHGYDAEMYEMGQTSSLPPYTEKKAWANPKNAVYPQPPPART